jgi:hypothetical protein
MQRAAAPAALANGQAPRPRTATPRDSANRAALPSAPRRDHRCWARVGARHKTRLGEFPSPGWNTVTLLPGRRGALSDVRLAFLLTDEAYERLVAQVFGIAREKQTFLVKLILTGALVTVLEGLAPRPPRIRPSGADTAIGAVMLNTALRGIVGAPSRSMPAVGALIGFALLAHSLRSAMTRSSRDLHALAHRAEARYAHHSAMSVATDRTARS